MKCPYCGARQKKKGVFCEQCGLRLVRKTPGAVFRRAVKKCAAAIGRIPKKVLVPALLILLVAVAALIAVPLLREPTYIMTGNAFRLVYDENSDSITVIFGTEALTARPEGHVRDYQTTLRGDRAAVLTENGALYLASPDSLVFLAEGVTSFSLSQNGDGIAYRDDTGHLYRRFHGKTVEVAESAASAFCLSPDGKTLAYATADGAVYTFDGKHSVRQDADGTPIFVTNGCDRLYHIAEENGVSSLYRNGKRVADAVSASNIVFSRDGNEVAFLTANDDGYRLCLSDGGAPLTLCSASAGSAIPRLLQAGAARMIRTIDQTQVITAAVRSFRDTFFRTGNELYYLAPDYTTEHLGTANPAAGIFCGEDYLYFVRAERGTLCRIALEERQNAEVLVSGVRTFTVTENEKGYYYVTDDLTLHYVRKVGAEPVRVRGDVETVTAVGSRVVFSNKDGFLYTVSGKSAKQIDSDVSRLALIDGVVYYEHEDGTSRRMLASRDGKNFTEVFSSD